jgi:hypothetical protein
LITPLCPGADFPIEFLCGGTHILARPGVGALNAAGEKKRYRVCAMQSSKWDFDATLPDDEGVVPQMESRDDFADRMGIRIALVALCLASMIAAVWFVGGPSFEKCSAIANEADRNACYDGLRKELLKSPAKGADVPNG